MTNTIVLLGSLPENPALHQVVEGFGWSVRRVKSVECLKKLHSMLNIVAVLFDTNNEEAWREVPKAVREAAPGALLVSCVRFSEMLESSALKDEGVFYVLRQPFARGELQQGFGFIQARNQSEHAAVV